VGGGDGKRMLSQDLKRGMSQDSKLKSYFE
jgi:hypothetical protein